MDTEMGAVKMINPPRKFRGIPDPSRPLPNLSKNPGRDRERPQGDAEGIRHNDLKSIPAVRPAPLKPARTRYAHPRAKDVYA